MAALIQNMPQLSSMLSARRAICLVSVPWSHWPRQSRPILAALESTQKQWSPDFLVLFFELCPEGNDELNRWYEALCINSSPRFELHGHGYGPLWWLTHGDVLDCLTRPYDYALEELQQRSAGVIRGR